MKSLLIFDFANDEDTAQKARHKVDAWKQGFRLGAKLTMKFDREDSAEKEKPASGDSEKAKAKSDSANGSKILVAVRLSFSPHEKLSYHRWLERIPAEEPFKGAPHEVINEGDAAFPSKSEWFDALT